MKLRMQITKEKEIRFISHLEYVRTIERAIRRAKLPAAYSEGFNPHLKFSLASALGVGVVSMAEFVEIELAEPESTRGCAEDDSGFTSRHSDYGRRCNEQRTGADGFRRRCRLSCCAALFR
ncbi:MAG: TIGR03936 family radical SAM-associated protein [Phascolarctobacterium faecium]